MTSRTDRSVDLCRVGLSCRNLRARAGCNSRAGLTFIRVRTTAGNFELLRGSSLVVAKQGLNDLAGQCRHPEAGERPPTMISMKR